MVILNDSSTGDDSFVLRFGFLIVKDSSSSVMLYFLGLVLDFLFILNSSGISSSNSNISVRSK